MDGTVVTSDLRKAVSIELGTDRYDTDVIDHYLAVAEVAIIERLWPFRDDLTWEDVPSKYHVTAVQIAVYLINKRGAEGETQHTESGASHTYSSAGIPEAMLRGVTPYVGVV